MVKPKIITKKPGQYNLFVGDKFRSLKGMMIFCYEFGGKTISYTRHITVL